MTVSQVFTDQLLNSPSHLPWFSPGYEGTKKKFYVIISADRNTVCPFHVTSVCLILP